MNFYPVVKSCLKVAVTMCPVRTDRSYFGVEAIIPLRLQFLGRENTSVSRGGGVMSPRDGAISRSETKQGTAGGLSVM